MIVLCMLLGMTVRRQRLERMREREEEVLRKHFIQTQKTSAVTAAQKKMLLDIAENVYRSQTAESILNKEEKFSQHMLKLEHQKNEHRKQLNERIAITSFKCEQKRKLQLQQSEQKSKLLEVQLEKLNVARDISESIEFQRVNALSQVFHDNFAVNGSTNNYESASPGIISCILPSYIFKIYALTYTLLFR